MNKLLPLLLMAFISTTAFAGPNCDWKPIKTDTTKSNGYSFQVVTLDCNIEYFKDDNVTAQEVVIRDINNNIVVNRIGNWGSDNEYYPDEASVVSTPKGFPYDVILTSAYGASNISHTYHIYSTTPTLKKVGEITQPLNKYQTTKGSGSEREVVGFYEDKGLFLIDRMTTEGTELGRCNACQEWNVETLVLGNNTLVPVDLKPYSLSRYKPFEMNEHYAKGLFLHSQDKRQEAIEAFTKASKDGIVAADLWIAIMSTSDINTSQTEDKVREELKELLLKFTQVKEEANHPAIADTATDYISIIKKALFDW
ncbi:MAG: hypothetical protein ABGY11_00230 [Candidatus Thioglobus sp.]